jgi:putative ABC transport system permease protein
MIMNVSERKREIGILRSQGMSKGQVVTSIMGEATFLGVVGFVMGIIVGLMFHRVTVSYMRLEGFPMAFIMPYDAMAVILVLAIATAVISSVYPADKASKLDIVDAIRN